MYLIYLLGRVGVGRVQARLLYGGGQGQTRHAGEGEARGRDASVAPLFCRTPRTTRTVSGRANPAHSGADMRRDGYVCVCAIGSMHEWMNL